MNVSSKYPVVLSIHENGNKEFNRVDYDTLVIIGSIGFNAVSGDIERARKRLYPEIKFDI